MFEHRTDLWETISVPFDDSGRCFWASWQPFAPPCSHEPCLKLHLVRRINVKMRNGQNISTSHVLGGFNWVVKPYKYQIHYSMFKLGALWMLPFKDPKEEDMMNLSLAQR